MINKKDRRETFWDWLAANLGRVRALLAEDAPAAVNLAGRQFGRQYPGLILEVGSADADPLEFYVSANGRRELFDRVRKAVAAAPPIPGVVVRAFRPRGDVAGAAMRIGDRTLAADDVWCVPEPTAGGVRVTLLIRGLDDESESVLKTGATVFLDHAVGEYDAGTKIAELDAGPLPDPPPAGAFPLRELPGYLDRQG